VLVVDASVLARALAYDDADGERARQAFADLADLPIVRVPHADMLPRIWELRDNVTPYDAAYVALAEALNAPLLTADARFAAAPGPRCEFRVLR